MGNGCAVSFKRGTIDVEISDILEQLTEEQYRKFLEDASEEGHLDYDDFCDDRAKLISRLPEFPEEIKKKCVQAVLEQKSPFQ